MEGHHISQTLPYQWQFFLFLVALFTALFWLRCHRRKTKNLPPGPKPWPIIGNLHQLKLPPHKTLYQLSRTYGPVMSLRLGSVTTVVISSSEKAKEFFKFSDQCFASRPSLTLGKYLLYNYSNVILAPYGPYWRGIRKMCVLQLLTAQRVESFTKLRRFEVDCMVESMLKKSEQGTLSVDLSQTFGRLTTNIIWSIICSRKFEGNEEVAKGMSFKQLLGGISEVGAKFAVGDFIPWLDWMDLQGIRREIKRLHIAYDAFAENIIKERLSIKRSAEAIVDSKDKPTDFLDILLGAHDESPDEFSKQTVKALIFDMAAAATDTSATAMEWTMSLLFKHPHELKKVQNEIEDVVGNDAKVGEEHLHKLKYLQCVVKEALRIYPPLPIAVPHFSIENTVLSGYNVPKGSILFLNLWAIARDPLVWEDPDEFRPERFMKEEVVDIFGYGDMRSIPFGSGRRGCPGAIMALPIIYLALASLVHCFDWEVEGEIDMAETLGVTTPRLSPLFAIPIVRKQI